MNKPTIYRGLEGIFVGETSISKIDGLKGELSYRGVSISDLVRRDFYEVCFLVLFDRFPLDAEKVVFERYLFTHAKLSASDRRLIRSISPDIHPMQFLQGCLPLLEVKNDEFLNYAPEVCTGLKTAAKIPSLLAAYYRLGLGLEILDPVEGLSFNANFLYCFTGKLPKKNDIDTFEVAQILQMEHGYNASTFSALVTSSTLAPVQVALSAAIGTLYGPLHGGADQKALEMAMSISSVDDVESFVQNCLKNKEKIMGMGHRVYKVVDPRANILKPMARDLCMNSPFEKNYLVLEKIEDVMERIFAIKGKAIKANVEFYKGPVFFSLGIPVQYFTAVFAMSRVFGYLAHILENRKNNKLIRPKAFYIGK